MPIDSLNVINLRNGQFDSTTRPQMQVLFAAFKSFGSSRARSYREVPHDAMAQRPRPLSLSSDAMITLTRGMSSH